jgi:hemoglobin
MKTRLTAALAAACLLFASTAPAQQASPAVPDPAPVQPDLKPVLDDFGGEAGLTLLMDDFMVILLEDPRMRPFFEKVDQTRVKRQLVEQFCAILGGGCTYTGRDMKASHEGLRIDRADFNALVEDLQVAMDRRGIPFRSQNRLLAVLAPMHREVITK